MRLLPAKTDHAGSALMGEPMRDVCAPDGHSDTFIWFSYHFFKGKRQRRNLTWHIQPLIFSNPLNNRLGTGFSQ